jgi:solute carrier family 25 folate transporter 32
MYRGYSVSLICIPLFNTLYFPLYEFSKQQCRDLLGWEENQTKLYSLSAGVAGIACNVITNPMWMVRTRMQAEIFVSKSNEHYQLKYKHGPLSMLRVMKEISKKEGLLALYRGAPASMIGVLHPLVFFPSYEKLKIYFK